jgi:hypothetical protein
MRVRPATRPAAGNVGARHSCRQSERRHYTFDPRLLAVVKIWQGGFLEMSGEFTNRGNNGLALGYDSREIGFGDKEYLLGPLNAKGEPVDFSFKEGKFRDFARFKAELYSKEDQLAKIAAADAQFLGYSRDSRNKTAAPAFKYRVGNNVVEVSTAISTQGQVVITVNGTLATPQSFALNAQLLKGALASAGTLTNDRWTLPAGKTSATLKGTVAVSGTTWRPTASNYAYKRAAAREDACEGWAARRATASRLLRAQGQLRARPVVRGAGLSVTKDGTVVVATRSAGSGASSTASGICFAEGLFDSLGVVAEGRQGSRRRRRTEGRAHAYQRHERRRHRRQVRDAVRRAIVRRQLSQLHARSRARQGWVLLPSR